ncbi:hydroxymethylbilane synthase [Mucilaginibacter polytrichastri]|uniref:Porphobilinogen deaminase n=1 Tax=Mucilaginibacter polytrichastri TaxID=1302689 RepID=A0A1Q6A1F8_9SPHI|nr:hydroxymethylbilane synthase [Mucilaginibacter polytrichastri]OKS87843.1 Porphobilinogen deaminase [Mucilaginibacter polytrichastri]SFT26015.1 hydroxymethylbilane synthase [Mucilaginibacter polytrichastri]
MERKLLIGTRGSDLALWQANFVKNELASIGITAELKIIKTQGDRILNLSFDKLEGKGFFTKEIEEELLAGKVDIAVHSHKDLPTENPPGLIIAAVSEREDPSELLLILKDCVDVHQKLSVKFGGRVGTSSNRRRAQLLAVRPDLEIDDLRGNVNTRIQKLRDEKYDAIMLAKAGISRLGLDLSEFLVEELPPTELIPAPAQGVMAIQIRENDHELFERLQSINHPDVAEQLFVERKVLNLFGGGCHLPLGVYCRKHEGAFQIFTSKADDGEGFPDRLFIQTNNLDGLPEQIVARFSKDRKYPAKVFISRDLGSQSYFRRALEKHGIEIEDRSLIRTVPVINKFDSYILRSVEWVFFTSKNAVEYFFQLEPKFPHPVKFGVMGSGSEDMLRKKGHFADYVGQSNDTAEVARDFAKLANGSTILFPGAENPMRSIHQGLSADTKIIDLPVYETVLDETAPASSADVLVFTSPSNVENYFERHLLDNHQQIVAIGKSTGRTLDELNIKYTLPFSPDEIGLSEAVFGL